MRHRDPTVPDRMFVDEPWRDEAACKGKPTGWFFPSPGKGGMADLWKAKAVCSTCPVRAECLEYALVNYERIGVWGGTSERERRSMRHHMRRAGTLAPPRRNAMTTRVTVGIDGRRR